jgi:hypothetical protein
VGFISCASRVYYDDTILVMPYLLVTMLIIAKKEASFSCTTVRLNTALTLRHVPYILILKELCLEKVY